MILDRIKEYIDYKNMTIAAFERSIGMSNASFGKSLKNGKAIGTDKLENILLIYTDINPTWLLTGEGSMLREPMKRGASGDEAGRERKLIPFYDDVITVGGRDTLSAAMDGHMPNGDMIDAGDWFTDATAAIRHYGDSMEEYPNGCILALKELHDRRQIIWGRNYCIETDEMRVTKRLQPGAEDYLMAYSSNTDTYPDGHLVHEPFRIYKDTIRRIFMVIGCITKEYSSGPVMIRKNI